MSYPDLTRALWRKSSRSGTNGGNCVEVATNLSEIVALRDSKDTAGPVLVTAPSTWRTFANAVKDGAYDL